MSATRLLLAARARQQPEWASLDRLKQVLHALERKPPLVDASVCDDLTAELARAATGRGFALFVGECAERFAEARPETVLAKADQLHRLADGLAEATGLPVTRVGRIAGQYAKPRSHPTETLADGTVLPVYRGDAVNAPEPRPQARVADPSRLLRAYHHAETTLSTLFERDLGLAGQTAPERTYAGHEALLLEFEQALVRPAPDGAGQYGSSGHFLWIGERTRQLDHEHVQFAASVGNPVGVKVGPTADPGEVAALIGALNPRRRPGRLTLIVRMGAAHVGRRLPELLDRLGAAAADVAWVCDPMHGNTRVNGAGQKTRALTDVMAETEAFVLALHRRGLPPAGLMLETAHRPVTECVATPAEAAVAEPLPHYETACDPRLDPEQARLVTAFTADLLEAGR
ncbi:3-deoxy-7-phosphoheptulonate synthase [Streptomyces huiliensis]|uniref:3-deoxy-7-phosphoheptulonate synthase n=1 Tax=Streptomyces huiliensis TaxID=2876027 RepID=UPI001CBAAEA2|nr:3-deoxy-7-phosphoheptulonate synthase [Streptomyces huiliensis]MBZ4322009.1 3-deoxy-7-phosphoheptulonate synthase [Streptomyces huiliensis]